LLCSGLSAISIPVLSQVKIPYLTDSNFITLPTDTLQVCINNTANFSVDSTLADDQIKWYADSIGNSLIDSGVVYQINGLVRDTTVWFESLRDNGCVVRKGRIDALIEEENIWTGAVSSEWENPSNWSCGSIPNEKTHVFIYAGKPNYPIVSSQATCFKLSSFRTTAVRVRSGYSLIVTGQ
jgi:hypothetical protein